MARFNPYLAFTNEAGPAMEFYQSVFGGTLQVVTFGESGASEDPSEDAKIMHAMLESDDVVLMASDTPAGMELTVGSNVSLSLSGEDEGTLRKYYEQLSEGGSVTMPLEKAPWGDIFGMFTDKFGISWMVNITQPQG